MSNHHAGLGSDLKEMRRRDLLKYFGGAGLLALAGCGQGSSDGMTGGYCTKVPEETAGPYPGDGSNGVNALALSGIVRSDIRSSFGGSSDTVAGGIPLTINLTITNSSNNCAPLAGYAVYLWHCDQNGLYSLYSQGVTGENYLRGVQQTDANGLVTFTSIFPACYSGRWPHIHFEVYPSVAVASSHSAKIATSQLALPETQCREVFATTGYEKSVSNLAATSLAKDNVFSDGTDAQLAEVTGNIANGYVAKLMVGVAVGSNS